MTFSLGGNVFQEGAQWEVTWKMEVALHHDAFQFKSHAIIQTYLPNYVINQHGFDIFCELRMSYKRQDKDPKVMEDIYAPIFQSRFLNLVKQRSPNNRGIVSRDVI